MTSHVARAPSTDAAPRRVSPIPSSAARALAPSSPLAPSARPIIESGTSSRPHAGLLGLGHERADDVVGDTERDAAAHERVGDGRRGRVALVGRRAHPVAVHGQRVEHPGQHAEARLEHGHRVEQRRLVLLEVALVGRAAGP